MPLHPLNISRTTVMSALFLILALCIWPTSVQAGCNLNIYVENKTKQALKIYEAKVKVRG